MFSLAEGTRLGQASRMILEPSIPPDLDQLLVSPDIMENPYPIYSRLRDEAPVGWSDQWQSWVVSRYEDVNLSLRDGNLSNEKRQELLFSDLTEGERQSLSPLRHYFAQKDVIGSDPPDHTRMRALVQKAFTPKTVASLEGRIRDLTLGMLEEGRKAGRFDFVHELAHPLPVILIAELLGTPVKDRALFKRWSAEVLAFQGTGRTTCPLATVSQTALVEMFDYITSMVEARRTEPKDDLLTALANAEEAGQRFSRDELLATCNTLLTAGHETTTNLIGNLVHLLLSNRDQWERLKAEPSLIDTAVEEALRFDAPKQRNFRRTRVAHEFQGASFQENQMVFQLIGSANRDARQFVNPDSFDIGRTDNKHLSLGAGIHFCLGAPLARKEAKIVLESLIDLMPDCRLAEQQMTWQERIQFRGPKELWIEV
jgi:cytochrome P450